MAANVGKLNVLVAANISALKKNLQTATQQISGFAKSVGKLGANVATKVAKFGTGLAAVGAGAVTVGLVKASSAMDDMAKKADTLGIGTEELVKLRHAGNLAGVGAEELDAGLGRMLKTIGEASAGVPAATSSIEALGLSVSDLQGLNADQQFGVIADAVNSFEDPAQRAAAAAEIFGKGFVQMMPLLTSGSAGIKAAGDEAERLGLTFSRLDASKVEGMNDAFTKLESAIGGVFQKIVVELAPVLQTAFTDGALAVADLGQGIAQFTADAIDNILFLGKTWKQQMELIKLDAQIAWNEMFNDPKQNPVALGESWGKALRKSLGLQVDEGPLGGTDEEKRRAVLLRDLTAAREQHQQVREAVRHPAKDESAFFKDFKASVDALDESAFFGPNASRSELVLGRATKVLDLAKDESAFFEDFKPEAPALGPSSQMAGAVQAGTTEGASAIFAAMSAKRGTDDSIATNTEQTATNTDRIATAVEGLKMPEFEVVEAL